jgi:hypothetical protein
MLKRGIFKKFQQKLFTILQMEQIKNLGFLTSLFPVDLRERCLQSLTSLKKTNNDAID